MLNARENLEAVINHGEPDRYSNNYEGLNLMFHPLMEPLAEPGGPAIKDSWGITWKWPAGTPGQFPVHDAEHTVLKDIEDWKTYVKAPPTDKVPEAVWDQFRQMYRDADRTKSLVSTLYVAGLFEMTHHLGSIDEMLMCLITDTDAYIDLVKYLEERELKIAELICDNLKPDVIFHHDDWGSEVNSFMSPDLFGEIFVEPYKNIYGYYKDHGVKYVFHHDDAYSANLVPAMIEMGIDVWQGPMHSNHVNELVRKYGDKISFMGNIDNKFIDFEGWTREDCRDAIVKCIDGDGLGTKSYIPCITQGGPGSTVSGTYKVLVEELDAYNAKKFGFTVEELEAARDELQIIFG